MKATVGEVTVEFKEDVKVTSTDADGKQHTVTLKKGDTCTVRMSIAALHLVTEKGP